MISNEIKSDISRYIAEHFGIYFPLNQWTELERKLVSASELLNFPDVAMLIHSMLDHKLSPVQSEHIATYLTVGETYFFRERGGLDLFINEIIPGILKKNKNGKKNIKIWSAGCCSGEEPYTIAILLNQFLTGFSEWEITILATDLNKNYIDKAIKGHYTNWSFRETPDWARSKYFTYSGKGWDVIDEIKKKVEFKILNLLDREKFPSPLIPEESIDIIFCRNVLMYFPQEQIRQVADRFYACLDQDGWLITSPVEVSNPGLEQFKYFPFNGWGALRKSTPNTAKPELSTHGFVFPDKPVQSHNRKLTEKHNGKKKLLPLTGMGYSSGIKLDEKNVREEKKRAEKLIQAEGRFESGHFDVAVQELEQYIGEYGNSRRALLLIVQSYANNGQPAQALQWCEKAIMTNPQDHEFHYLQGSLYAETEHLKEAEKAYRQALYINPDHIPSHLVMGNLLRSQGKLKEAGNHFRNLAKLLKQYGNEEILKELDNLSVNQVMGIVQQFTEESE